MTIGRQFGNDPRSMRVIEQELTKHDIDLKRLMDMLERFGSMIGLPPGSEDGVSLTLPNRGVLLGKTDAAVTAGNTVTVSKYNAGSAGGSETDTGENVTCYSRTSIDSGLWVNFVDRGSYYECFPLECNA